MNAPDPGRALSSGEFLTELRWSLAQVSSLHDPGDHSEERLAEVCERVSHLRDRADSVYPANPVATAQLVVALGEAREALRPLPGLPENAARHRATVAQDQLSAALGAAVRSVAGE